MLTHLTLWLAQIQFFASVGFMLLFVVLEFALAWILLYLRLRATGPERALWTAAYRFWVRVFALASILGFSAAVAVLIQLGSLWPDLLSKIGDVAAPLLAGAILSTFISKSVFLGAMLFGMRRLADKVHIAMIALVALGVTASCFCLLALIAWMHAPSGATMLNGQYAVFNLTAVVFNPALPVYTALFLTISMLSTGFLMMAVVSGQAARNPNDPSYRRVFRLGVRLSLVGIVCHLGVMAWSLQLAASYQPAKAAAVAAYWDSGSPPELIVAAWPDAQTASNRFVWSAPASAAAWLAGDGLGGWRGLDQFSGMTPPVALTFWSFRLMLFLALFMGLLSLMTWLRVRRHHYDPCRLPGLWRSLLRGMGLSGWVLLLLAMAYVQLGSFPYAVYGTVTLSEILAPLSELSLVFSNVLYGAVYLTLVLSFLHLLRYVARYGVVPVGRRRGRA